MFPTAAATAAMLQASFEGAAVLLCAAVVLSAADSVLPYADAVLLTAGVVLSSVSHIYTEVLMPESVEKKSLIL